MFLYKETATSLALSDSDSINMQGLPGRPSWAEVIILSTLPTHEHWTKEGSLIRYSRYPYEEDVSPM